MILIINIKEKKEQAITDETYTSSNIACPHPEPVRKSYPRDILTYSENTSFFFFLKQSKQTTSGPSDAK